MKKVTFSTTIAQENDGRDLAGSGEGMGAGFGALH